MRFQIGTLITVKYSHVIKVFLFPLSKPETQKAK
jgi:hypothetical protein